MHKEESRMYTSARFKTYGFLCLLGLACDASAQDKFSVDWYLHHPEERSAKLLRCERYPTESIGQSCTNARVAERMAQEKKSDTQPMPPLG